MLSRKLMARCAPASNLVNKEFTLAGEKPSGGVGSPWTPLEMFAANKSTPPVR
jgi:hypothetical protein